MSMYTQRVIAMQDDKPHQHRTGSTDGYENHIGADTTAHIEQLQHNAQRDLFMQRMRTMMHQLREANA